MLMAGQGVFCKVYLTSISELINLSLMNEYILNQVQELRSRAGVTQEELAKTIGATRQTIIAIEKGHYTPSVLLALKIAKFFKKSLEEIFQLSHEK